MLVSPVFIVQFTTYILWTLAPALAATAGNHNRFNGQPLSEPQLSSLSLSFPLVPLYRSQPQQLLARHSHQARWRASRCGPRCSRGLGGAASSRGFIKLRGRPGGPRGSTVDNDLFIRRQDDGISLMLTHSTDHLYAMVAYARDRGRDVWLHAPLALALCP